MGVLRFSETSVTTSLQCATWISITTVVRTSHTSHSEWLLHMPSTSRNLPTHFGQCPCCNVFILSIEERYIEQQPGSPTVHFPVLMLPWPALERSRFQVSTMVLPRIVLGCDVASFGVSRRFERKYCLKLQGLMGTRRPTSPRNNQNNNNPTTRRYIPEDINAQVKPYPVRPWLVQLNRRHLNLLSEFRKVGLICFGVSAQRR
jgi:hypothetical protein